MSVILIAFLLGIVAGLRSITPLAAVSWAARLGWLHLENTSLAFLGHAATPWILSLLALGEIVNDKLPKTPSRKAPAPFIARVVVGMFCGAVLALANQPIAGGIAGALGAVAGTLGGYQARTAAARAFGKDLPAALIEDAVAVCAAFWLLSRLGLQA